MLLQLQNGKTIITYTNIQMKTKDKTIYLYKKITVQQINTDTRKINNNWLKKN